MADPYERCYASRRENRNVTLRNPQLHASSKESAMAGLADKFAVNLKNERIRRKLSQESLAKALSVSPVSLLS